MVREGDTLWDLAGRYFGDPLLWPEIYRQNTMVVEDPHWIYPGEVLRLSGTEGVSAIPQDVGPAGQVVDADGLADAQGQDDERGPLETRLFQRRSTVDPDQASLAAYQTRPAKPLNANEFYSSGFLTEGRSFPFGRLIGPVTPKEIGSTRMQETAQLFSKIFVDPPSGGTYQIGCLATFGRDREYSSSSPFPILVRFARCRLKTAFRPGSWRAGTIRS
jgi:hypothetical protein